MRILIVSPQVIWIVREIRKINEDVKKLKWYDKILIFGLIAFFLFFTGVPVFLFLNEG